MSDFFTEAKERIKLMEEAVELKISIMKPEYRVALEKISQFPELEDHEQYLIKKEIKHKTGRSDYENVLKETFQTTMILASLFPK